MEEVELRKLALEFAIKYAAIFPISVDKAALNFYQFLSGEKPKTVLIEFKCDRNQLELCLKEFTEKIKSLIKVEISEI